MRICVIGDTHLGFEKGSELEKVVIGIGINVNQTKFVGDFKIQPTSIKHEMRKSIAREKLLSEVLNTFEELLFELKNDSKKLKIKSLPLLILKNLLLKKCMMLIIKRDNF